MDALEALHPGEIERILIEEIERYFDATLVERLARVTTQVETDLARITNMIYSRHADQLLFLDLSRDATAAEVRRLQDRIAELENRLEERARRLFETIGEELDADGPTVSDYDWPEPEEGDEDPDPLFDSTRDYMEQLDRYREHQGKPEDASFKLFTLTCQAAGCGRSFQSRYPTARTCSKACRNRKSRELERARGPRKRDRSRRR